MGLGRLHVTDHGQCLVAVGTILVPDKDNEFIRGFFRQMVEGVLCGSVGHLILRSLGHGVYSFVSLIFSWLQKKGMNEDDVTNVATMAYHAALGVSIVMIISTMVVVATLCYVIHYQRTKKDAGLHMSILGIALTAGLILLILSLAFIVGVPVGWKYGKAQLDELTAD